MSSNVVIAAHSLCRSYRARRGRLSWRGDLIAAVRDVSFDVHQGELFGLLGPNGAGKTTVIRMLNTLLVPTSGNAYVCGLDVVKEAREVRRRIGYVFGGDRGLYDRLSALDNLRYFAELYNVPLREQHQRIGEVLEIVGLTGRERDRVETYSRGMRQRLHIARGLLHKPEVLFLDEPSIGVDPVAARELRKTVSDAAKSGTTVILTTHYMAEAEELCGRIAVIADGEIRALGTPGDLKRFAAGSSAIEVEAFGIDPGHVTAIRQIPGVEGVAVEDTGNNHVLTVIGKAEVQPLVMAALGDTKLIRIGSREPTLEDAYVAIVSDFPGSADAERA
jgi:ABC-2 type transport system ATP-binding protein